MPVGRGIYWTKYTRFTKKLMTNESISMESIVAMDWLNKNDMFLENGKRVRIKNGWFCSERKFEFYPVDGYAQVGSTLYLINYDGCYFHHCDCIDGRKHNANRKSKEADEERNAFLKEHGTLIILKGCEFKKKFNKYEKPLYISPLLYRGLYNGL